MCRNLKFFVYYLVILLTSFIFFNIQQTSAQEKAQNKSQDTARNKKLDMYVGVKGGINLSYMDGNIHQPTFLLGPNAGFFFTYNLKKDFGFTAELLFTMNGTKRRENTEFANIKLNYLEIPILCQYYLPFKWEDFKVKCFLGPYAGYLLSAKDDGTKVINDYNKADFGFLGGVGFQKKICHDLWVTFDTRYQHSLLSLLKTKNADAYNGTLSFNIGIACPIDECGKKKAKGTEKGK